MRRWCQFTAAVLFSAAVVCLTWAQEPSRPTKLTATSATSYHGHKPRPLTQDDRLAVIAAALDSKAHKSSGRDCSHLVHNIYEQAGLPYVYASSDDLYDGVEGFQRVRQPQPGDLVVWHGHVGIVIRPSRHVFFSYLSAGPGTDNYQAPYWVGRGQARFYRYIKQ